MVFGMKENLSANMEDYLEAILALTKEKSVTRVGDIADRLDVKSSSVNSALTVLVQKKLVVHEKYGYVELTPEGKKIAQDVQKKHDILFKFLSGFLCINEKKAIKEACIIEHSISSETFMRLTKFFQFIDKGYNGEKPKLLKNFEHYLNTGEKKKCDCEIAGRAGRLGVNKEENENSLP